ncbi:MAG: HAD family hydrolase [Propionibacteriaceae bacterium]|nr:HAD family hydrolase [Propionibacteriaceae bacterium]
MPERPALVALDIDGTLAGEDGLVSAYSRQIVSQLAGAEVSGVIISGRPERSVLEIARSLGLTAPVISYEGAVVTDPVSGSRMSVQPMTTVEVEQALAAGRRFGLSPTLFGLDDWYAEAPDQSNQIIADILGQAACWGPLDQVVAQTPLVKVMLGASPERLDQIGPALEAACPALVRSMPDFYGAVADGVSKEAALAFVLDRLGLGPDQAWGFGDSDNDIGWLSSLGWAVVPANARPGVKALADQIIGHHSDDSVARHIAQQVLDQPDRPSPKETP